LEVEEAWLNGSEVEGPKVILKELISELLLPKPGGHVLSP
jgi:hypothetical protein